MLKEKDDIKNYVKIFINKCVYFISHTVTIESQLRKTKQFIALQLKTLESNQKVYLVDETLNLKFNILSKARSI